MQVQCMHSSRASCQSYTHTHFPTSTHESVLRLGGLSQSVIIRGMYTRARGIVLGARVGLCHLSTSTENQAYNAQRVTRVRCLLLCVCRVCAYILMMHIAYEMLQ